MMVGAMVRLVLRSIMPGFLVSSISDSHARPELTSAGLENLPIFRNIGLAELCSTLASSLSSPLNQTTQHRLVVEGARSQARMSNISQIKGSLGLSRASDLQLYRD